MPFLSAFTPLGLLSLDGEPSPAETIYDSLISAYGGNKPGSPFCLDEGTHLQASIYSRAMGLARSKVLIEHAGAQDKPNRVLELLAEQEREWGVVPGPTATISDRRAALAVARLAATGNTRIAMEEALRALLGDDFVGYATTARAGAVLAPAAIGDQPMNLLDPRVPRKLVRLLDPVYAPGVHTVRFELVLDDEPGGTGIFLQHYLEPGDVLVIDPVATFDADRVTATSVSIQFDDFITGPFYRAFTATFTRPHQAGVLGLTAPWPLWTSSKLQSLVVIKPEAYTRPTKRAIDELMAKKVRGTAVWSVGVESAPNQAGPFIIGQSLIGVTPFGTVTF